MLPFLLLVLNAIIVHSEENVCLSGRVGKSQWFLDGLYTETDELPLYVQESGSDELPAYVRDYCWFDGNLYQLYLFNAYQRWLICDDWYIYAACSINSTDPVTSCNGNWAILNVTFNDYGYYVGHHYEIDEELTIESGECPSWDCDRITTTFPNNSACGGVIFDTKVDTNAWSGSKEDQTMYFYYYPEWQDYYCSSELTYECDFEPEDWSYGWVDLNKGDSTMMNFNTAGQVEIMCGEEKDSKEEAEEETECNIDLWQKRYENTLFAFEGECTNDGDEDYGKFTAIILELVSVSDESTELDLNKKKWKNGKDGKSDSESGVKANKNRLRCADDDSSIEWTLMVFEEEGTATINEQEASVKLDSIKFAVNITNWNGDGTTLNVCFTALSYFCRIREGGNTYSDCVSNIEDVNGDGSEIMIGEYRFNNEATALCTDNDDINVGIDITHLEADENQAKIEICYQFNYCESGNIVYDPFVYYEGDEETDGGMMISFNYYTIYMYMAIIMYYYL